MTYKQDRNNGGGAAAQVEEAERRLAEAKRTRNEELYNKFKSELDQLKQKLEQHTRGHGYPMNGNGIPRIPGYVDVSSVCEEVKHAYNRRVNAKYGGGGDTRSLKQFDAFLVGHVTDLMKVNRDYGV